MTWKRFVFLLLTTALSFLTLAAIFVGIPLWAWETYGSPDNAGVFGDTFGSVNAVVSGLAFGGVIFAILLQRRELQLQRDELGLTRTVLTDQRRQLEKQANVLVQQQFDNTFFQLVRLHHDIVAGIDLPGRESPATGRYDIEPTTGRDCFARFFGGLRNDFKDTISGSPNVDTNTLNELYLATHDRFASDLGHYFRNLYTLIKFVHQSNIPNKRFYTNIVRAQLSTHELLMLFYNCLSDIGAKFKPLVEEYSLLKNMPLNGLLHTQHRDLYETRAFDPRLTPAPPVID